MAVSYHGVLGTLSYLLFHPVLHNWCNKGHGMNNTGGRGGGGGIAY